MKKIIFILSLLLSSVAIQAQSIEALDNLAAIMSKGCPRSAGEGLTLNEVISGDDTFTFVYSISDEMFDNISKLGGIMHDSTLAEMVSSPKEDTQKLLSLCRQNKIKIIVKFGNTKGNTFDITILPEEL